MYNFTQSLEKIKFHAKKIIFFSLFLITSLTFSQSLCDGLLLSHNFDQNVLDNSGNDHHGEVS